MMVKRITLVRRREDMTRDDFAKHLLGEHAEIAKRAPNLRGYRVNLVRQAEAAGWDAVVESWFDSEQAAVWPEPVRSEIVADRPKFIKDLEFFFVDEHVVVGKSAGA
jgi:EthD domain-containing protein